MKIEVEGVSEIVLEVKSMNRAVEFWTKTLGFPIVEQWGYEERQFTNNADNVWATWLYIGGNTRLGLWLPREFSEEDLVNKEMPVSRWNGFYDEGGIHVHFALHIKIESFESAISILKEEGVDIKIVKDSNERRLYFKDTEDNVVEFYTLDMKKDYLKRII
ncbi:VOC family protein [Cohnella abietis]|uniref:VOC domain-containing protein n=1 Tax=Cohnella abietis TaxID=2507935 RepID=A0A3T1CYM5_9BACL|nr:VOC family protein [Cohnella abietis]BBI30928.1 hypothetical protein KCTCHS21_03270 [Cohnella abietis]